ncbi:MAG TPA: isoaspartyl peptidase/L-asparaginase, partial [Gemmataceae bacterium]|nr:isoaspartyl peptidase/L-asparaginase [Gemmataceae bacterium]
MRAFRLVLVAGLGLSLALLVTARPGMAAPPKDGARKKADAEPKVVLVIHGGAGVLDAKEMKAAETSKADYEKGLAQALRAGYEAMRTRTSVDGVEKAIRSMEECRLFNAGRGAALNREGKARLDAAIMDGNMGDPKDGKAMGKLDPRKRAGAVADVGHINSPISAARAVMEMKDQRAVLLVGEGAER